MNKYDLVIIGSGASGLSAGVSALKSGVKNVLILEKEDLLGCLLYTSPSPRDCS